MPGGGAPIGVDIVVDLKAPTRYLAEFSQGGLGMPDRDYFLVDRPNYVSARTAYRAHIARMLALGGRTDTPARAERVLALETRLAASHRSREDSRNADKSYNPRTPAALAAEAPGLDWPAFLDAAGVAGQARMNVDQTEGVIGAARLIGELPIDDWRDYLTLRALRSFAPVAPKAVFDENFDFQSRTLSGTPQPQVRWRRAIALTETSMGHATSQLYLDKYFPPQARAEAEAMTANIKTAMGRHIRALPWMNPVTKARALKKLANLNIEIGAEKTPRDFSGLVITPGDAWGNYQRAYRFNYDRKLKRIDRPVDRGEWGMLAQTVNASANYSLQKLMIPAGYLQPPLFDPGADPAVNYGGIGRTMGHELSHQFDDQGSKFDENGALNDWWQPQDLAQFNAAGAALATQYDAYEVLPGLHINGRFTLGENIGDVAGLALAYDAWKISLNGKPAPVLAGYTGDQRFYMSHAQVWRIVAREAYLRRQITADPHSPGEWRAAQVRNLDPWYAAFKVTPAQKMYLPPAQRVRVW
jgi:putative endopeptidase